MGVLTQQPFCIDVFQAPGKTLNDGALADLSRDIREIAAACFHTVPDYQAMVGTREALADKLTSIARDANGVACGFCLPPQAESLWQNLGLQLRGRPLQPGERGHAF